MRDRPRRRSDRTEVRMQNGEIAKRPVIHLLAAFRPTSARRRRSPRHNSARGVVGVCVEKEKSPADDDAAEAVSFLIVFVGFQLRLQQPFH